MGEYVVVPPQIVLTFHKNSAAYPRYPKFVVFGYISRICNTIHKKYIYIIYIMSHCTTSDQWLFRNMLEILRSATIHVGCIIYDGKSIVCGWYAAHADCLHDMAAMQWHRIPPLFLNSYCSWSLENALFIQYWVKKPFVYRNPLLSYNLAAHPLVCLWQITFPSMELPKIRRWMAFRGRAAHVYHIKSLLTHGKLKAGFTLW